MFVGLDLIFVWDIPGGPKAMVILTAAEQAQREELATSKSSIRSR